MDKYDYALLALAALILAAAFLISPQGSAASPPQWAPATGIYYSGLNRNSALLPDEEFPPH